MITPEAFHGFQHNKVLVIGDLMVDSYLTGTVSRFSPEAPVPVLQWGAEVNRLGGAANVALNISALGATPYLCGVLGDDEDGRIFYQLIEQLSLSDKGIITSKQRVTTVKTRVINSAEHLLRIDKESELDLTDEESITLWGKILELLETVDFDIIILQDYNKGVLSKDFIQRILRESQKRKIPIAVDPKFNNFWEYKGVELFKPNLKEVNRALQMDIIPSLASLDKASKIIREKLHNKLTLITLSEHGVYIDDGQVSQILPGSTRQVADVCGAGDAVISISALALVAGLNNATIAQLANLAGGQVVEKVGVVPVDFEQLKVELR